jgi:RHS repeat-associated protein
VGAPAGTVQYLHDQDGHLIAEANASTGATTRDYIWLASNDNNPVDLPLAIAETTTLTMVHADHLGRPTRMTDAARATVWQATWKPWGEIHTLSGTLTQNLRYPGQYFQIETGLHYNHHRNYDPITGRYTQPDPLRFVDGPAIYAYAKSSPFMYTDRTGLEPPRGERGATGGSSGQNTNNPYKGCRSHPTDPNKIRCKHHQTGKWIDRPKPADWPTEEPDKKAKSCESNCTAPGVGNIILVGGVCIVAIACILSSGGVCLVVAGGGATVGAAAQ